MAKSKAKFDYSTSSDDSQKYTLGYSPRKSDGSLYQAVAKIYPDDPDYEYESSMGMDKPWTPENPYINGDTVENDWDSSDTTMEAQNILTGLYGLEPSKLNDGWDDNEHKSYGQYYNMPHRSKGYTPKNEAIVKPLVDAALKSGGQKQSREEFTSATAAKFMDMLKKSKQLKQEATPTQLSDYAKKYADSSRSRSILESRTDYDDVSPLNRAGFNIWSNQNNEDAEGNWRQNEVAAKKEKAKRKKK